MQILPLDVTHEHIGGAGEYRSSWTIYITYRTNETGNEEFRFPLLLMQSKDIPDGRFISKMKKLIKTSYMKSTLTLALLGSYHAWFYGDERGIDNKAYKTYVKITDKFIKEILPKAKKLKSTRRKRVGGILVDR